MNQKPTSENPFSPMELDESMASDAELASSRDSAGPPSLSADTPEPEVGQRRSGGHGKPRATSTRMTSSSAENSNPKQASNNQTSRANQQALSDTQQQQQMHVCRLCDKLLSSSSSLDRHMLTHSGERPFVCKRCQMTFTTNGEFRAWF